MMRAPDRRGFLAAAGLGASLIALPGIVMSQHHHDPLAKRFGGPFSLVSHDGKRISDADYRGRFMLIYFGFTRCPDLCPIDLPQMAQALDMLGPEGVTIAPLFITVDPEVDTPQVMADYVKAIHPRLVGLTGSEAEIAAAARAWRVHRVKMEHHPSTHGRHNVDHGTLTYLMGPDGGFLTLFPHNTAPEKMATTLRAYLARAKG
ncbi:MAG: SCO family protein [Bosea sp. (in: a-proteobacteria)]